jgi:hypothetical protein
MERHRSRVLATLRLTVSVRAKALLLCPVSVALRLTAL